MVTRIEEGGGGGSGGGGGKQDLRCGKLTKLRELERVRLRHALCRSPDSPSQFIALSKVDIAG